MSVSCADIIRGTRVSHLCARPGLGWIMYSEILGVVRRGDAANWERRDKRTKTGIVAGFRAYKFLSGLCLV